MTALQAERRLYSILVVDDHEATRYALTRGLNEAGFRTVEASTGAEGLELASFVSAVVLDVNLPDLHGHEVTRLLRSRYGTKRLPVVQISAVAADVAGRQASLAAGANDHMAGPVEVAKLVSRLDTLLQIAEPSSRSGSGSDAVLQQMIAREKRRDPDDL